MPEIVVGRDDEDLKKYKTDGTLFIGKHIVGTGEDAHLTTPVLLDAIRPHIILFSGKRGSGKSYSLGILAEEIKNLPPGVASNLCSLIVDTQGIFWTMKNPNEKDANLLSTWSIKPAGFDIVVYVPEGQARTFEEAGVDYDETFSIAASELTADDWLSVFGLRATEPLGIVLQRGIAKLKGKAGEARFAERADARAEYSIDDIIASVASQQGFDTERLALTNMFLAAKEWGIFGEARMPEILVPNKLSVLDISLTPQNVRALLLAIAMNKVLEQRTAARRKEELAEIELASARRVPMPWIFVDEAHNFLPAGDEAPSSDVLLKIVKEGRQPGITLVLATQRPERLHADALAQADMIISHRLTAKADIDALKAIMQTYMLYDISKYINELPKLKGTAIILDDNSERIYKIRMRPRQSWHAGASPVAI